MRSPWRANCFHASLRTASSAAARNSGMASRIVTSAPRRRHTEPSSSPITPAPITPRRFGTSASDSAPTLSQTSRLSIGAKGSVRGREPVATMTCAAASRCVSSLLPGPGPTAICQASPSRPTKRPKPWIQSILFLRNRNSMPRVIFCTIDVLRACIRPISMRTSAHSIPCAAYSLPACSKASLEASSALDGMQPTFRQVPPSTGLSSSLRQPSMQATCMPSCAARMAAI